MGLFDRIVEQHLQQAIRKGELDHLPGMGQPLKLEDDSDIPEESRMAYRVLKNAGYLPPEMEMRKDLASLKQMLDDTPEQDSSRREQLLAQINEGWSRYNIAMERYRR